MIDEALCQYTADVFLLGLMVYREAAGEPYDGRVAVACTVMNRAEHPKWWGSTPYEVITKPMQYSSMTAKGDPMTVRFPSLGDRIFMECLDIAFKVVNRRIANPCPGADSYYAVTIAPPAWADEKRFVKQIGHHRFYNLDGDPAVVAQEEK
jgi:cell wall hydrolase